MAHVESTQILPLFFNLQVTVINDNYATGTEHAKNKLSYINYGNI